MNAEGFEYREEFISAAEEAALLAQVGALPLEEAKYKQYTARRRVALFQPEVPAFLLPLRDKIAAWMSIDPAELRHALVNEYRPGTPLGWHRDAPDFERVAGVSLGGWARMRFRPYPPAGERTLALDLAPRSAYILQGKSRWEWQHAVSATKALRYSITFRSLRARSLLVATHVASQADGHR